MNNKELNIALGKLFNGIELDTHKVELGLYDDMLKYEERAEKLMSDVKDRLQKVATSLKEVKRNYEIADGILEDAMKMAKELGADDLIKLYNKREASIKGGIREVDTLLKKVK